MTQAGEDLLTVRCPFCEARIGERCYRILAPFKYVRTHEVRARVARRANRKAAMHPERTP